MTKKWLKWATELQSIAQAGMTFAENQYDIDRYQRIRNLSIEILLEYTDLSHEKIRDLFVSESAVRECFEAKKHEVFEAIFD